MIVVAFHIHFACPVSSRFLFYIYVFFYFNCTLSSCTYIFVYVYLSQGSPPDVIAKLNGEINRGGIAPRFPVANWMPWKGFSNALTIRTPLCAKNWPKGCAWVRPAYRYKITLRHFPLLSFINYVTLKRRRTKNRRNSPKVIFKWNLRVLIESGIAVEIDARECRIFEGVIIVK